MRTWGLATLLAGILIALTPAVAQAHFTTFPSGSPLNGDTTVVTGLCAATGVAVDSAHLWVNDACSGQTTRYPTGGTPPWSPDVGPVSNGLTYGLTIAGGSLYGAADNSRLGANHGIYPVDEATLALGARIATTPTTGDQERGMAADPLTGDVYFGTDTGLIYRIHNPSRTPTVTLFATMPGGGDSDGMQWTADGSMLWVALNNSGGANGAAIAFDRSGNVAADVPLPNRGPDGIAVANPGAVGAGGVNVSNNVFVNDNDGTIVRIDVNNGDAVTVAASGGARGDIATVGPDGCFYVTQAGAVDQMQPCFFQSTNAPPRNVGAPYITGPLVIGQTLTCNPGSWLGGPTFTYAWSRDGMPTGVTTPTYGLTSPDAGHQLTCTVTATNPYGSAVATSAPVSVPVPPPPPPPASPPTNTVPPKVTGTPLPGDPLNCSAGSWNGSPTTYAYRWNRTGHPIGAATTSHYTVQVLDEAQTLSCTVTATNPGGSTTATSPPVLVAQPGTLHCPKPFGHLGGTQLGPFKLGMTRQHARKLLKHWHLAPFGLDDYCFYAGWGIRVGYPSKTLLRTLSAKQAKAIAGRIILFLSANPFWQLDGIGAGDTIATATRKLHLGKPLHIGANYWYEGPGKQANVIIKSRHGIVLEIGLANKTLTTGRKAQARFLRSFGG